METIANLVVIGLIAVIGTILYMKAKKKTTLGKGGGNGTTGSDSGKGDLKNPK